MKMSWKKAVIAASVLALAPVLSLITGGGSAAYAHTRVSGSVVIGGPTSVFGFSYGDPFAYGHVHHAPVLCSHGPLYFFPAQGVYAHYYPAYRYYRYATPVSVHHGRKFHHHKRHHYYVVEPRHRGRHDGHGHDGHGHDGHGHGGHGHGGHGHGGKIRGHRVSDH